MKRLMVAVIATSMGMVTGAGAAEMSTIVTGSMANSVNACTNLVMLFNLQDCSYAATRYPAAGQGWTGPYFSSAFYGKGSAADGNTGYNPSPGDGKLSMAMTGTVTIDDQGSADPADDAISATWTFGAAVHNAATGNADRAVESWDSWTHVMAATPVSFATANASGGFDYVIGSRGAPTLLAAKGDAADTFASENTSASPLAMQDFWSTAGSTDLALAQRIGIERSAGYGNSGDIVLQPNIGGQTTASFTGYQCLDNPGDNDCSTSELLFGSSLASGSLTSPPGFDNLILVLSTGADGLLINARAYWTREFRINIGPGIGNDPPAQFLTDNSWMGGTFTFTAVPLPATAWLLPTAFGVAAAWRRKRR